MSSDPLLQPFKLKHLTLRNRIMSTSHEPAYGANGMPAERYRLYHVEKAKGGIALTMTAGSAVVAPDSAPVFGNLHLWKDEIVQYLKRMAEECHEHGAAVMIQITHLGRRTRSDMGEWLPAVGPSAIREAAHRGFPKVMEDWDFERILKDYVAAAERVAAAGFDGFEIECYGHLLDTFWSPLSNTRTDEWGGCLENRMRFSQMVFDAVRKAVGPKLVVGARLVADEQNENGITREDGVEIAKRLVASGNIDFLNVIRGRIDTHRGLSKVIPVQGRPSAMHLDFAGEVRAATKFPVFHAARISDVATARHAIREGLLDMVGMTRAHMADPHIARKVAAGQEDRIRPCVNAAFCLDHEGGGSLCIHSPATSREAFLPHEVPSSTGSRKKIVIVGAGPAGLEAARVAGERGHEVVVFEAASRAGGQVRLSAQLPRRAEMISIIDWRLAECERLGVNVRYNFYAQADDVLAEEPDVVIIATGGLPNTDIIRNGGSEFAVSTWDILSGDVAPGENVIVYDDGGHHAALQAAEFLAHEGAAVEIVTPERSLGIEIGPINLSKYGEEFAEKGVRTTIMSRVVKIEKSGNGLLAAIGGDYSERTEPRHVDQVVVEHGTLPLDELYWELKEGSSNRGEVDYAAFTSVRPQMINANPDGAYQLFRIGDAVASRNIHGAIYDAYRLCLPL